MRDSTERCNCRAMHRETVARAGSVMPPPEELYGLSWTFKVFGDPTRIRTLCALLETELCVCDIACLPDMTQSSISHQLKILKQLRPVKCRRDGKTVLYALDDDHVKTMFDQGLIHVQEHPQSDAPC